MRREGDVLGTFPVAVIKHLTEARREGRLCLDSQFHLGEKVTQRHRQEPEAVGHTVTTVKKQKEMNVCAHLASPVSSPALKHRE